MANPTKKSSYRRENINSRDNFNVYKYNVFKNS